MFKFRIKSKSTSAFLDIKKDSLAKGSIKNIKLKDKIALKRPYGCLEELHNIQLHWKDILEKQLDFSWSIAAFQNSEGTYKVDPKKKLMLRETFLLKKSIINCISLEKYDGLKTMLEELKKTSTEDSSLAKLFTYLLQIRSQLIGKNFGYYEDTIKKITTNVLPQITKYEKQHFNTFYGRIIYILALHMIKLRGVLLKKNQMKLILEALNIKKQQFCAMAISNKKDTVPSLLFLSFQFYKILYLIKADQDLSLSYYNKIKAYISIWKTKLGGYQQFETKLKIQKKLQEMIPLRLNLKIYQDHDRRRLLSLQNAEQQLIKRQSLQNDDQDAKYSSTHNMIKQNEANTQKHSDDQKQQNKNELLIPKMETSGEKLRKSKLRSMMSVQIEQFQKEFGEYDISLRKEHQKIFSFSFLYQEISKIYVGSFDITISEDFKSFNLEIILNSAVQYTGIFKIFKVSLEQNEKVGNFAKKLWKIVKEIFYTDKSEFIPSLFSFQFPPLQEANSQITEKQLPILVRIHSLLLHYIRKQSLNKKTNGRVLFFPSFIQSNLEFLENSLKNSHKIFTKRIGFISFNKKNEKTHEQKIIKAISLLRDGSGSYIIMCAEYEEGNFIGISIYQKQKKLKNEQFLLSDKIKGLKYLSHKPGFPKNKIIREILEFIEAGQKFQTRNIFRSYRGQGKNGENIEQEFQVMKSPILQTHSNCIADLRKTSEFPLEKNKPKQKKVLIKIKKKYWASQQVVVKNFYRYYDNKKELILENQYDPSCQVDYQKHKIYKYFNWKEGNLTVKGFPSKKNSGPIRYIKKSQEISVIWIKTVLFRCRKTYFYLNFFNCQNGFLLELWNLDKCQCFMGIFKDQQQLLQRPFSFDQKQKMLNNLFLLETFISPEKTICTAQAYFNIKNKALEKKKFQQNSQT